MILSMEISTYSTKFSLSQKSLLFLTYQCVRLIFYIKYQTFQDSQTGQLVFIMLSNKCQLLNLIIQTKMRYLVINGLCCCLNLCCKEVWEAIYQIVGKRAFIKCLYCVVFLFSIITTLGFILLLQNWSFFMEYFAPEIQCKNQSFNCLAAETIFRVSCCLFVFSILMIGLVKICSTRVALILNEGLFFSKYVAIMILVAISFQMSGKWFELFGTLSSIVSYIFLIAQSIILIDLAYLWGIDWAKKYTETRCYGVLLIVFSIAFGILSIVFIILSFSSHVQNWVSILGIIEVIIMIGVQLLNYNKQNSLLTTSLLCVFVGYQTWSSSYLHPSAEMDENFIYSDMAMTFILLWICTFGSIYGSSNQEKEDQMINLDGQENNQSEKKSWISWLIYLAGLSMFLAMVLTNWGSADIVNGEFNLNTNAWASKIFFSSSSFILYCWSLLAPKIVPNRNFYFQ